MNDGQAPTHQPRTNRDVAERALVRRAIAGDRLALSQLLEEYQRRVYGVCFRMIGRQEDAEDLTQDVLTKLITSLDQYSGRSSFSTWVVRIAMNTCLSHLRKKTRRRRSGDYAAPEAQEAIDRGGGVKIGGGSAVEREPEASEYVERFEERLDLHAALGAIGDEARALLILRDVQGFDYQQISEVFKVPVGTIKSRLFRARLALRKALEQKDLQTEDGEGDLSEPSELQDRVAG